MFSVKVFVEEFWTAFNAAQKNRDPEVFRRMYSPQPGDYVIEVSSLVFGAAPSVGILKIRDPKNESRYIIETLGGETVEWKNAKFYKVPDDLMAELLEAIRVAEEGEKNAEV